MSTDVPETEPEAPPPEPAKPAPPRPFHPLLFAAFPVLSLLAHNRHEAHLAWAIGPLMAALVVAAVLWTIFGLLLRSVSKGALPASLGVLLFFSFGHTVVPLADRDASTWHSIALQVVLGELVVLLILCLLLRRMRSRPNGLTRFANVASLILVLLPILNLTWFQIRAPSRDQAATAAGAASARTVDEKPDIYLIIPDAHARADVMRDLYDYDMAPFLQELEEMGFAVARESTSNYSMTPLSIASMLNLDYLDEFENLRWNNYRAFAALIRDSSLEKTLRSHGYKTVAFPTGAPYTEMRHYDQYYHGLGAAAGFYRLFVDLTPIAVLLEGNQRWNEFISDRERLLFTLEEVPVIASDPAPTFTFVHLELPHPPFRFGEDGQDVFAEYRYLDDDGASRTAERQALYPQGYRRQAIYADKRLAELARRILLASTSPPVILIVSDHGPRLKSDWNDPSKTDAREALGNLVAVHFPGGRAQEIIYDDITPVNVLRLMLNECLDADLPLLPDRAYLSSDIGGMHQLTDVTQRLNGEPAPTPAAD